MSDLQKTKCIMVIFGGTGDLTHRKLIPALYNLAVENLLPEEFAVVSIGRRDKSDETYRKEVKQSTERFSRYDIKNEPWNWLEKRIHYFQLDFPNSEGYFELKKYLDIIDQTYKTEGNRLFYFSVSPEFFEIIPVHLRNHGMIDNKESWQRVIIEKPFGKSLESAKYLNTVLTDVFPEENIFRIDHYLGKEMLQNIMVIRFGNTVFEGIWNNRFIDNIQITAAETVGVETRAGYYENSGALLDMVQNHLLQLLALIAMEPPVSLQPEDIRTEKLKVFRSLTMTNEEIKENIIRGQYDEGIRDEVLLKAYRDEAGVNPTSNTETFVAMKLFIKNFRWGDTPFYIRTGKRMPNKTTKIVIEFKSLPGILYFKDIKGIEPNLLIIEVNPNEGVKFRFNTKKPGTQNEIINDIMEYCQNCRIDVNSPEAYEKLISDAFHNDQTLFTSWNELYQSWSFVDQITKIWKEISPDFPNYNANSWGPAETQLLLEKDGKKWW